MVEKSVQIQKELDKSIIIQPISYYKNYKITCDGGTSVTIGASSQTSTFKIPSNNVLNFSKMSINFNMAAIANVANMLKFIHTSFCPFWSRIELLTSQNLYLVNLNNVREYNKLSAACNLNKDERTNADGFMHPSERNFNIFSVSGQSVLGVANNNLEASASAFLTTPLLARIIGLGYGVTLDPTDNTAVNIGAALNLQKSAYHFKLDPFLNPLATDLIRRAEINDYSNNRCSHLVITEANANGELPQLDYSIRLGDLLPDSIFNVDKDIYISDQLTFRITWVVRGLLGGTSEENGISGAAVFPNDAVLTNLYLNHYIQANPEIVQLYRQQSQNQEELIIPEIQSYNLSITGAGNQSTSIKIISNATKSRLYKCYGGLFTADALFRNGNSCNINEIKYSAVNVYLNSNMILTLDATSNEDYDHTRHIFKNHSFRSISSYKECGVIPLFFSPGKSTMDEYNNNELKGQDFMQSNDLVLNYQFTAVPATALIHNIFCVILRPIYMKQGILSPTPFN